MYKHFILLCLSVVLSAGLYGQKKMNWKKLRSEADQKYQNGAFAEAAELYEAAWEKKSKKKELIYQAAESYYLIQDYRKAANAYQHVSSENEDYPLVGLKYARSLKQDAQYDKAKAAFRAFLDAYNGEGKSILEEIIRKEVLGCELAAKLPLSANRNMDLLYAGSGVNSEENEFGAWIAGRTLYMSSDRGGKARIYSSESLGGSWDKATTPNNFPVIRENYAYPTVTSDGSRMYFTICNSGKAGFDELKSRCELFVTKKTADGWGKPQRLPDFINLNGVSSTMPSVHQDGNKEILYFASNRENGRGGMDIWYVTRELTSDDMDFTFPANLGPSVNSIGDEITPFYDASQNALYFSSNGHISIGGYDVFLSQGTESNWTAPKNVGLPVNSSANDYGYQVNSGTGVGVLVTNRVFGGDKVSTTHSDILYFNTMSGGANLVLRGDVFDRSSGAPLENFTVELYQLTSNGEERLLFEKPFTGGAYELDLIADRAFMVVIKGDGFRDAVYDVATNNPDQMVYGQPVYLDAAEPYPGEPSIGGATGISDTRGQMYTARGTSPEDNLEYITNAPRYDGVYYKIQLAALQNYDENNAVYQPVKDLGRIDTEKLVNKNLTRILLADFFTSDDAFSYIEQVKQLGFNNAYVVKYEDGVRYGKISQ